LDSAKGENRGVGFGCIIVERVSKARTFSVVELWVDVIDVDRIPNYHSVERSITVPRYTESQGNEQNESELLCSRGFEVSMVAPYDWRKINMI
jgi:hypothetical protein